MANGESSERVILQLRAVLRGIIPLIWRRLLVPSDTSIAQLHELLQVAFGWEDMHLHRFEIRGREYGLGSGDRCRTWKSTAPLITESYKDAYLPFVLPQGRTRSNINTELLFQHSLELASDLEKTGVFGVDLVVPFLLSLSAYRAWAPQ
jgi:Plasmid pRiA4b ORF-3-like protein